MQLVLLGLQGGAVFRSELEHLLLGAIVYTLLQLEDRLQRSLL